MGKNQFDEFDEHVEAVPCDRPFVISKEALDKLNSKPKIVNTKKYEEIFKRIKDTTKDNGQDL